MQRIKCKAFRAVATIFAIRCIRYRTSAVCVWWFCCNWDSRNRLTQVVEKNSAGTTVTNDVFTFDVENRRIGKSVNGTQSWYSYDGQNSYADFNGSGSLTVRYLTGQALDSLYARFDGTNTRWYLDDILASVRQVVNTSGTVLDALTYDSYGQLVLESNSANGDRFKYTSREWDSEIGQYFYRARSYTAFNGRFVSQDPERFAAEDANLYRYTNNNPINTVDPQGTAGVAALAVILFVSAPAAVVFIEIGMGLTTAIIIWSLINKFNAASTPIRTTTEANSAHTGMTIVMSVGDTGGSDPTGGGGGGGGSGGNGTGGNGTGGVSGGGSMDIPQTLPEVEAKMIQAEKMVEESQQFNDPQLWARAKRLYWFWRDKFINMGGKLRPPTQ